jgi:hypothetical protein
MIKLFNIKGDKPAEISISNLLTALTKRGELVRVGGRYQLNPENGNKAEWAADMQQAAAE